jgi:hypothetical protein
VLDRFSGSAPACGVQSLHDGLPQMDVDWNVGFHESDMKDRQATFPK